MAISTSNSVEALNQSFSSNSGDSPEQYLTIWSEKYVDTASTEKSCGYIDSDIIASRRNNLKCYECGFTVKTQAGFTNHQKKHMREEAKKKRQASQAFLHKRRKSELNLFLCPECDRQFVQRGALTRHLKTHKTEYVCDFCHQSFKDRMDFEWHDAINDGVNFKSTGNLAHRTRSKSRLSCHRAMLNNNRRDRAKSVPTRMSYTPILRSNKRKNGTVSIPVSPDMMSGRSTPCNQFSRENTPYDLEPMDIEEDALLDDDFETSISPSEYYFSIILFQSNIFNGLVVYLNKSIWQW